MHGWVKKLALILSSTIGVYALTSQAANEEDTQLLEHAHTVDQPKTSDVEDGPLMHSMEESESLFKPHQIYLTLAQHQSQVVIQLIVAGDDVLPATAGKITAHQSLTKQQTELVQATIKKLTNLATSIALPEEAQCKVLNADVSSDFTTTKTSDEPSGDATTPPPSSDFQGLYQLDCEQVEALNEISINAFSHFPKLESALVEWMKNEHTGHALVTPGNRKVEFKNDQ